MRSLLLASAAVLFTTGIACAQMSNTSPAPASAAGEQMGQPGAPGGKAAPNSASSAMQGSMGNGAASGANTVSSSTSTTPGYNGQDAVTNGNAPSTQTGPMGQKAASATSIGASGSGSHHWAYGAMPENADARTYLRIARMDIQHHNRSGADEALNRAETRVLTRSVPASGAMTDDSPMVTAIENARQAVNAGNFHEAALDTDMAMHHHMSGGMGMGSDVNDGSSNAGYTPSPHAQENGNKSSASSIPGDGTASPGMSAGASSGSQQ